MPRKDKTLGVLIVQWRKYVEEEDGNLGHSNLRIRLLERKEQYDRLQILLGDQSNLLGVLELRSRGQDLEARLKC